MDDFALAHDLGGEQQTRFRLVVAIEDAADGVGHVVGRNVGEKAEATEVDADERHAVRRQVTRDVQQRAIAADDHGQIDVFTDGVERLGRREIRAQQGGGALFEHDRETAHAQEFRQAHDMLGGEWVARLADEGDGTDIFLHMFLGKGLYR